MHFTEKSYLKLPKYTVYHTNHTVGTVRGVSAIIEKNSIKYPQQKKLHGLSPRATAACRRNDYQLLQIRGATWSA
jgi:hypothetical protein